MITYYYWCLSTTDYEGIEGRKGIDGIEENTKIYMCNLAALILHLYPFYPLYHLYHVPNASAMLPSMRRILAALGLCLLVTACGSSSASTCTRSYWDGTVGTCLPDGWRVVDRSELDDRGVPDEVLVAFQSQKPYSGQFATITVTREPLQQPLTGTEYSDASILSVQTLPNYTEIDLRSITVDDEDVVLHVFTAQPQDDQPESRFYQLSSVKGNAGYTFTAATPVSIPDELEDGILAILGGSTFTAPEGAATEE